MINGQAVKIGRKRGIVIKYSIEKKAYLIEFKNGLRQYIDENLID
jgi:hypothetical protein